MRRWLLVSLLAALPALTPSLTLAQAPEKRTLVFDAAAADRSLNVHLLMTSPEVVYDGRANCYRLARSVLMTDEMGATDYRQGETLNERVQAKKVVVLDTPEADSAELLFFGSAKEVRLNGKVLPTPDRLPSTGWSRIRIPTTLLKAGANELIFKGPGQLLVEPAARPGRSFKSEDGGTTWGNREVGAKNHGPGEYLIRLRLGRHAARGWVSTQVFDLWAGKPGTVPAPGKLAAVHPVADVSENGPPGTRRTVLLRTGPTPDPDAPSWTRWVVLDRAYRPAAPAAGHRWAQLKFELSTEKPLASPRVPLGFRLDYEIVPDGKADASALKVVLSGPGATRSGTAFDYEGPSPRLKLLRERYKLDEVIAPGKTELEQLMLLRYWVRNQWHTAWGSHPAAWMPPWDSLIILESKDRPDCLTMCTHYAAVFTQCCQALGWNARHCILDHHCVAEVYSFEHDRWVMMDAGNSAQRADVGLHFEAINIPLSARELHLAWRRKNTKAINVRFTPPALAAKIAHLCRPAPAAKEKHPPVPEVIPLAELDRYPVCGIDNYRRYAFPARNTFLTSLVPGELYQGWSEYFYDGYCWVGDGPDEARTSPEYTRLLDAARPDEADWKLGWVKVHLSCTGKPGELRVDLETHTPNLARFEKVEGGKAGGQVHASFVWRLRPGRNELAVRAVNHWGKSAPPGRVAVEYQPAP